MEEHSDEILEALKTKACLKQKIYRKTLDVYKQLNQQATLLAQDLTGKMKDIDESVEVGFKENGDFESELKYSGDTLLFMMHTNVFSFAPEHYIRKTNYVKSDERNSYCGMIMIYNFLSDSIKYNRFSDVGYLIGRIFVNYDNHFFVQGVRQLSFLYNDFEKNVITDDALKNILKISVLHSIDFDLFAPPFESIREITLMEKIQSTGTTALKTGKRVGFTLQNDQYDEMS